MTLGIGSSMGGYPSMMGISGMGSGIGTQTGNINQYLNMKYGCEDCFRKEPYIQELPKPYLPLPKESAWLN